jgi:hypothetical protein
MLAENCNLINLYKKPGYCVMSKAFSISKNTAAVGKLLLKLKDTTCRGQEAYRMQILRKFGSLPRSDNVIIFLPPKVMKL